MCKPFFFDSSKTMYIFEPTLKLNDVFMKNLMKKNAFYFIAFSGLLFFFITYLLVNGKSASFIQLNQTHNKILDLFFTNFTFLGDGLFSIILTLILCCFIKYQRKAALIVISYAASGLLAQLFKNIFKSPRPKVFFSEGQYQYFIDGVSIANNVSFPSGHTTSAFALATILACSTTKKWHQFIFLFLAVLVGYSRIYLGQHFLTDVLAGAILGTIISIITLSIANKIKPQKHIVWLKKDNQ